MACAKATRSSKKLKNGGSASPIHDRNTAEEGMIESRDKEKVLVLHLSVDFKSGFQEGDNVADFGDCSSIAGTNSANKMNADDYVETMHCGGEAGSVSPPARLALLTHAPKGGGTVVLVDDAEKVKNDDDAGICSVDGTVLAARGVNVPGSHQGAMSMVDAQGNNGVKVSFREALTSNNIASRGGATSFVVPGLVDIKERVAKVKNHLDNGASVMSPEGCLRRRKFHQHDLVGRVYGDSSFPCD
ncbi:hypothetical protein HPP92_001576 [Vanilla planifolia]|uniref:Uncharacterized protein n=1 Tax=Vanilla planifolia TaxID=51239 RepID=A0A835VI42_VANPL|nr:hypothetical protein HPP92_001576 [Vanilla planifolia]